MIRNNITKPFQEFRDAQKSFKDKFLTPSNTCSQISNIIENLFRDTNFKISNQLYKSQLTDIWSTLNVISNKGIPFLMVGGKGISEELAEASGYGELMERLQAGYFFSKNPFRKRLVPKYVTHISEGDQTLNLKYRSIARKLNPYLPRRDVTVNKYVKIVNVYDKEIIYFDKSALDGGTGYAAGNCYEEAFIQALCEIFERYVGIRVVLNKIKCPTIPVQSLSKVNAKTIRQMENAGIDIKVKDFSLNKKFPVIGILFFFKDFNHYEIKIGSATSIDVAVERCLTEFFQIMGLSIIKRNLFNSELSNMFWEHISRSREHFIKARKLYKLFPYLEDFLPYRAFISFRLPRHNFYPSEELEFLTEDHGEFEKWSYLNENMGVEIKSILKFCKENDLTILLKDFGWLGFPTVKVIVPELYYGHDEYHLYPTQKIKEFTRKLIDDIYSITKEDLAILSTPEFLIYACLNSTLIKFFKVYYRKENFINVWIFFGLLASALGERNTALKFLKLSMNFGIDYTHLKLMKNKDNILPYLKGLLPECIRSCIKCSFKKKCRYVYLRKIEKFIYSKAPDIFMFET